MAARTSPCQHANPDVGLASRQHTLVADIAGTFPRRKPGPDGKIVTFKHCLAQAQQQAGRAGHLGKRIAGDNRRRIMMRTPNPDQLSIPLSGRRGSGFSAIHWLRAAIVRQRHRRRNPRGPSRTSEARGDRRARVMVLVILARRCRLQDQTLHLRMPGAPANRVEIAGPRVRRRE